MLENTVNVDGLDPFNKISIKEYITNPKYTIKDRIELEDLMPYGLSAFIIANDTPDALLKDAFYYFLAHQLNCDLIVMKEKLYKFYKNISEYDGFEKLDNALSLFSTNIDYKVDKPTLYTVIRVLVTRLLSITVYSVKIERYIHVLTAIAHAIFLKEYESDTTTPIAMIKFILNIVVNSLSFKFLICHEEFKIYENYFTVLSDSEQIECNKVGSL